MTGLVRTPPPEQLAVAVIDGQSWIEVYEHSGGFRVEHHYRAWGGQSWQYKADVEYHRDFGVAIRALLAAGVASVVEDVVARIGRRICAVAL